MGAEVVEEAFAPVLRLLDAIGIAESYLHEDLDTVSVDEHLDAGHVQPLTKALVDEALDPFQDGVSFSVRLDGAEILSGSQRTEADFGDLAELKSDDRLRILLRLKKSALLEASSQQMSAEDTLRLWLREDAMLEFLAKGWGTLQSLWADEVKPITVLLPFLEGAARGPLLDLVGCGPKDPPRSPNTEAAVALVERLSEHRRRSIPWDSAEKAAVTPPQLAVDRRAGGDDWLPLLRRLNGLFFASSVLHLADRVRTGNEGDLVADFFTGNTYVAVPIPKGTSVVAGSASVEATHELIEWIFTDRGDDTERDWSAERLPLVQSQIARLLQRFDERDRLIEFSGQGKTIRDSVTWQWRAFVSNRLDEFDATVREVEGMVDSAVSRYEEQVAEVIKRVSDTALAAVAAFVGSFLAAALRPDFDETLFRIGMWGYGAYVALFPGCVGLSGTYLRARSIRQSFESRRRRLVEAITKERVDYLIDDRVNDARGRLKWFAIGTGIAYLLLTTTAAVMAIKIPGWV